MVKILLSSLRNKEDAIEINLNRVWLISIVFVCSILFGLFGCSNSSEEVLSHLDLYLYIKFRDVYTIIKISDNYEVRTIALTCSYVNPNGRRFS